MNAQLFIFGLGYSSCGVARQAQQQGWSVASTARKVDRFAPLQSDRHRILPFDPAAGHLLSAEGAEALQSAQYVLTCIPPVAVKLYDPVLVAQHRAVRQAVQQAVEAGHPPPALGYLSSTGVYGDWAGDWVDESCEPRTATVRGLLRLEAEQAWVELAQQLQLQLTVFRLGGIYGPRRSLLSTLQSQQGPSSSSSSSSSSAAHRSRQRYTSRCHVADVAQAVLADMKRRTHTNTGPRDTPKPSASAPSPKPQYNHITLQQQQQQLRPEGCTATDAEASHMPHYMIDVINVVDDEPAPRGEVVAFAQVLLLHSSCNAGPSAVDEDTVTLPTGQVGSAASFALLGGQQSSQPAAVLAPAAVQDSLQPAQQQPVPQQPEQGASDTQTPVRQQQKAREPLEEKRVGNGKLKQLLQEHPVVADVSTGVLVAPTYREGLQLIMDGLLPFEQVDLDCLYKPQC